MLYVPSVRQGLIIISISQQREKIKEQNQWHTRTANANGTTV